MPGRILKIKTGYNPNSSSIGLDMIAFFTVGAAVTVLFDAMAAIVSTVWAHKHVKLEKVAEMKAPVPLDAQESVS